MSITMLQHFDYPETLSYEGNATLSDASKFGKACAHFRDSTSKVTLTNTTGVFNLSASGSTEAECFVKVGQSASINVEAIMKEELLDEGYHIFDGHVFKAITDTKTWENAKLYCEALGGHLATITSAKKQAFMDNWVSSYKGSSNATSYTYLLGGRQIDWQWQWVTGEEWNYTNWASGNPDSLPVLTLYCKTHNWITGRSDSSYGFI